MGLQYFDKRDLLVLYLDELKENPLGVLRTIEAHLGLSSYDYANTANAVYNPFGHWGKIATSDVRRRGQPVDWESGTTVVGAENCEKLGIDVVICSKLYALYRPHLLELQ